MSYSKLCEAKFDEATQTYRCAYCEGFLATKEYVRRINKHYDGDKSIGLMCGSCDRVSLIYFKENEDVSKKI